MAAVSPGSLVKPMMDDVHVADLVERATDALIARGALRKNVVTFSFTACAIPDAVLVENPILRQSCIAASILFFRMQQNAEDVGDEIPIGYYLLKALKEGGIPRIVLDQLFNRSHQQTEDGQPIFNFSPKVASLFGMDPSMKTPQALDAIKSIEIVYRVMKVSVAQLIQNSPIPKMIFQFSGSHDLSALVKERLLEKILTWCCQNDTPDCILSNHFLPVLVHYKQMNNQQIKKMLVELIGINPKVERFLRIFEGLENAGLLELPLRNIVPNEIMKMSHVLPYKRLNEMRRLTQRYLEFELTNNEKSSPKSVLNQAINSSMETLKREKKQLSRAQVTARLARIPANAHLFDLAEKMKRLLRVHRLRSSTLQIVFDKHRGVKDPWKLQNLSYLLHDHFIFCVQHLLGLFESHQKYAIACNLRDKTEAIKTIKSPAVVLIGILGRELLEGLISRFSYEEMDDKRAMEDAKAVDPIESFQYDLCSFQPDGSDSNLVAGPEVFPDTAVGAAAPPAPPSPPRSAAEPARPDKLTPFRLFLEQEAKSDAEGSVKIRHVLTKPMLALGKLARRSFNTNVRVRTLPKELKVYYGKAVKELLDHLFLATDELEKLLNSVVNGYYQQMHSSIHFIVLHVSIALEQYLSIQYLVRHQIVPTEHSLEWLTTNSRIKLTEEEDRIVKQWDKAMIWTRFPPVSMKYFQSKKTPFPPALHWLQFGLLSYQSIPSMTDLSSIMGELFDHFQAVLKMIFKAEEFEAYSNNYISTLTGMKKSILETIAQKKPPYVCKTVIASEKFSGPVTQLVGIRHSINEMLKNCRDFPSDQNPTTELEAALHLLIIIEDGYLRLSIDGKSGHTLGFAIERLFHMGNLLVQFYRARLIMHQFGPQVIHEPSYYHRIFEQLEEPVKAGDIALIEELHLGKSHHYRQISKGPLHAERERLLQHKKHELFPTAFAEMPVEDIEVFRMEILTKLNRFVFILVEQVTILDKTIKDKATEIRKERAAKSTRVK